MMPVQNFHVAVPSEHEKTAKIEITNNSTVFVNLLDSQPPPPTTAATTTANSNAAAASATSTASAAGPVGGTTVTQHAPTITGQSMTGPTITGPTIHINMPQNFQQSAPSVLPQAVQSLFKKAGQGTTTQPALGKPGAKTPANFLPRAERIKAVEQLVNELTSNAKTLLLTHFKGVPVSPNNKVSDF